MIASQQSSLPLSSALLAVLILLAWWRLRIVSVRMLLAPVLAALCLCGANLAAHGRFAVAPFGNIFPLARIIYDGPGMAALRQGCPASGWRLCPFLDRFPPDSDSFLWTADSPLNLAGGPKLVSRDADAIIAAATRADPAGAARAALGNAMKQVLRFDSGDGLEPWPEQVTPWIKQDFPAREQAAYAAARQQHGMLVLPGALATTHRVTALLGVAGCLVLLPWVWRRRAPCLGTLLAVLLALPVSAAITGALSMPHDRYQSRIMWLPPFAAVVALASLRRGGSTCAERGPCVDNLA